MGWLKIKNMRGMRMGRFRMKVCPACGRYTLATTCPVCGEKTRTPHPPKFSPEDRYGKYRRMLKRSVMSSHIGGDKNG